MNNKQGDLANRFKVVLRVLIFLFNDNCVLLQKGSKNKKLWANQYNGVGGHLEKGETILQCANRELYEETGLINQDLHLCGSVMIDVKEGLGVALFIFAGKYFSGDIRSSDEGIVKWVEIENIQNLPIVEDLPVLLSHTKSAYEQGGTFFGRSWFDKSGRLRIDIEN